MIKVNLIAVGKIREKYFREAIEEYEKRLKKYCEFKIIEVKEETLKNESQAEISTVLARESEGILRAIKGEYFVFAPEGDQFSSVELSKLIKNAVDLGGEINFVIGSSYGLNETVKKGAKGKISFSKMTFPHALFRVCACEQIYRAFTIISGATYHK